MDFKLASAADGLLRKSLKEHWSAAAAFREIVAFASSKHRSAAWKKVAKIEVGEDLDRLTTQLAKVFAKKPPPKNINGFWFGLFEDVDAGWTLYACGSRRYKTSGSLEWAVQPDWWPEGPYLTSKVLKQLTGVRPQKDFDTSWLIETCAIFPYAAIAVTEALRRIDPARLLGSAPKRGVACGFDAGDCFNIGELTKQGLRIHAR